MESLPSINSGVFTELLIPELWSVKKLFFLPELSLLR